MSMRLASLTDEEIAAIDEAGAKGPPSEIVSKLRKNKYVVLGALLLQLVFLGTMLRVW